jgi:hypothetical protein
LPPTGQPQTEPPEFQDPPSQEAVSIPDSSPPGTRRWSEASWYSFLYGWRSYRVADPC